MDSHDQFDDPVETQPMPHSFRTEAVALIRHMHDAPHTLNYNQLTDIATYLPTLLELAQNDPKNELNYSHYEVARMLKETRCRAQTQIVRLPWLPEFEPYELPETRIHRAVEKGKAALNDFVNRLI